jgi:hypothetical protein
MAVLSRRFAPDRCVVLDDSTRVQLDESGRLPVDARVLDLGGHIVELEAA